MNAGVSMDSAEMEVLISRHMRAEKCGDVDGAGAVYTEDVEHDAVGFPGSPRRGRDGAREFYENLKANFRTEGWEDLHRYVTADVMILEQAMTGVVIGSMLGLPGNGRRVTFRMLHLFEFRDGLVSRENIWLDSAAIVDQLT